MLLTACNGGETPAGGTETDGGGNSSLPSAAPPAELDNISGDVVDAGLTCTLTLGNVPPDLAPAAEKALFEGYIAAMNKQYPNVTVVPAYYSYTLSSYVGMARGGTAPNIFQPPFTDPQLLISQELVADVTGALQSIDLLDKFSPSFIELLGSEGRIYGLPRDGYVLGLHLNLNLFEEAGLMTEDGLPMYPKTLQELAEVGRTIREKTGKAGLVFPASETYGGWLFTNIAWNFGATGEYALERVDEDGRWICDLTSEPVVAALEYVKSLRWEYDILNADATTTDWAGAHSALGTGEAAMNFAADDSVAEPTAGKGLAVDKFALAPFPSGPKGSYSLSGGTCFMFSPDTTHDQAVAALGFLKIIGMLPFMDDDVIAGMRAGAAAKRERGAPVLPPIPAWNDEDFIAKQREIAEEYTNVDMRLYDDFFHNILIKAEEPVFAQQLYRELTSAVQRVITREDADVLRALERAQEAFQEYLDDEMNS
jgi:ABC-type glycerol-3-phosphate transport system substrate-binding protein